MYIINQPKLPEIVNTKKPKTSLKKVMHRIFEFNSNAISDLQVADVGEFFKFNTSNLAENVRHHIQAGLKMQGFAVFVLDNCIWIVPFLHASLDLPDFQKGFKTLPDHRAQILKKLNKEEQAELKKSKSFGFSKKAKSEQRECMQESETIKVREDLCQESTQKNSQKFEHAYETEQNSEDYKMEQRYSDSSYPVGKPQDFADVSSSRTTYEKKPLPDFIDDSAVNSQLALNIRLVRHLGISYEVHGAWLWLYEVPECYKYQIEQAGFLWSVSHDRWYFISKESSEQKLGNRKNLNNSAIAGKLSKIAVRTALNLFR